MQYPADAGETLTIVPNGVQATGELNLFSGSTSQVNVGTNGTGGVNLKTPVTQV